MSRDRASAVCFLVGLLLLPIGFSLASAGSACDSSQTGSGLQRLRDEFVVGCGDGVAPGGVALLVLAVVLVVVSARTRRGRASRRSGRHHD